ncbi:cytochrome c-type biogenesis protein CcmH [Pseudoroseicyclus sp. CXY001]|uniref:cytochrome c-type biogenesis protein n=1 Tax=Pseudoroseicyclus sp. CXY001 TaxID=3242492 RepID=UPI00358DCE38
MRALLLALLLALPLPALAVQPDEMLDNPALEARARDISQGIRCPVCQGETIDDSNADIARTLRLIIRERLVAGDSDAEVVTFLTDRFGEFVLMRPPAEGANLALWLGGPLMLLLAGGIGLAAVRRRAATPEAEGLSAEEEARLAELLKE